MLDGILQVVRGGHLLVGEEVGGCRSRGVIDRDVVQVVPTGARREGVLASPLVDETLGRARLVVVVAQGAQVARHPAQSVELRSLRRGVVVRHPDVPAPEYPAVGVADGDEGVALPFTGREVDAALLEADVGEQRGGILPQQCGRRGGELRGGERFGRYAVAHYGGVERICAGAVHQIAVGASRSAQVAAGRCRGWCGVGFIVLASGCKHQRNRTHQQQKLFHGIRFLRGFDGVKKTSDRTLAGIDFFGSSFFWVLRVLWVLLALSRFSLRLSAGSFSALLLSLQSLGF